MSDNLLRWFRSNDRDRKWLLCLSISLGALALTYWPQGLAHFRYDRNALLEGQGWRLLTGHLVHLNTAHLLLNLAGMILLCELLWRDLPILHGAGLLGVAAGATSGALYWWHPELAWYAGLSGALHGLWAGCALAGCLSIQKRFDAIAMSPSKNREPLRTRWPMARCLCAAGMLCLIMKLAMELRYGASPRTVQMIGNPVVTVAHLYGALAGVFYVLIKYVVRSSRH